jgi:hypothetical protein
MSILSFISGIFKPAAQLVDDLTTSDEEKLQLKAAMMKIENEFATKVIEYQAKLTEAQSDIIGKEATGHSWLQRNWRPITMLTFLVLVLLDSIGLLPGDGLNDKAWTLLEIGLGGYVVGRSAEKILLPAIKRRQDSEAKG